MKFKSEARTQSNEAKDKRLGLVSDINAAKSVEYQGTLQFTKYYFYCYLI